MAALEGVREYLNPGLPQIQVPSSIVVCKMELLLRESAGEPSGRKFTPSGNPLSGLRGYVSWTRLQTH